MFSIERTMVRELSLIRHAMCSSSTGGGKSLIRSLVNSPRC
jgi:hypothetical protein